MAAWIPIAASVAGGLASGLMSKSGGQEKTEVEPWRVQAPHLEGIYNEAERLYHAGPQQYYPGQTWVDPNYLELLGRMNQLGFAGGPMQEALGGIYSGFGSMVDPTVSPYMEDLIDLGQRKIGEGLREQVLPSIRSDALQTGQFTSSSKDLAKGLAGEAAIQSMEDLNTRLLADAYNRGMTSRERAMTVAPSILGLGMQPGAIQQQIGGMYRGDVQNMLQDYINRWNFGQDAPWSNLERYAGIIGAPWRSSTTQTAEAPMGSSIIGGALAGYGLGQQMMPMFGGAGSVSGVPGVNRGSQQDLMLASQWMS